MSNSDRSEEDYEDDLVEDQGSDLSDQEEAEDEDSLDQHFDLSTFTVIELQAQFKARGLPVPKTRKAGLVSQLTAILLDETTILDDVQRLDELEDQLDEEADADADDDETAPDDEEGMDVDATIAHLMSFDTEKASSTTTHNTSIAQVLGVAACASVAVYLLLQSMPVVPECSTLSVEWLVRTGLAKNTTGLKQLHSCTETLAHSAGKNKVTLCYMALYVFFQTFAIPGPNLMLSILAGALFENVWLATLIVGGSCTTGAVCCYMLSHYLLTDVIQQKLASRIDTFKARVTSNKDHLLSYMLFLRLTPLLPNWFINLSSPVVGIPVSTFACATFFGQMPMNLVFWFSGNTFFKALEGEDGGDPFEKNLKVVLAVSLIGLGSLMPVLLKKRLEAAEAAMGEEGKKEGGEKKKEEKIPKKAKAATRRNPRRSSRKRR